jgi:hypothetical protein
MAYSLAIVMEAKMMYAAVLPAAALQGWLCRRQGESKKQSSPGQNKLLTRDNSKAEAVETNSSSSRGSSIIHLRKCETRYFAFKCKLLDEFS